jgi:site-specific DNA recombinase
VPAILHNIKTKKLQAIPAEAQQVHEIFALYAQESISLRRLLDALVAEGKQPLNGSSWTTAKLSALLKNPIYVKADSDVYDYYDQHGVQMITDVSMFTGKYGAQLYGRTKHDIDRADWSDMKLVLLTHAGIVNSDTWLKCQRKLEKNRQVGNSVSNLTSWLAGRVVCEKCGHTMTTIKGKRNRNGELRRYFHCTGKSHKKTCTGPRVTIYAEDLEGMIDTCIFEKLTDLGEIQHIPRTENLAEINELKLKIKAIEKAEKRLVEAMLEGGFNKELLALANQKATQFKQDRLALYERMEALKSADRQAHVTVNPAEYWKTAGYKCKKAVAMIMIHKIVIGEDGSTKVLWNL